MAYVELGPGVAGAATAERGRGSGRQPRGMLPDFSWVPLDELAGRTQHPVLRALLPEVAARLSRPAGSTVAYYDDAPEVGRATAAE